MPLYRSVVNIQPIPSMSGEFPLLDPRLVINNVNSPRHRRVIFILLQLPGRFVDTDRYRDIAPHLQKLLVPIRDVINVT